MPDLAANALTNILAAEGELGIATGTEDDTLSRLINVVSAQIENFLGRKIYYEASIEETMAGHGTMFLVVERKPLLSIASISYDGDAVASDQYEIQDADAGLIYGLAPWKMTGPAVSGITQDPFPGYGRKLYTVTYAGGWVTQPQVDDDGNLTRSLPYDIEDACLMAIATRYRSIGRDRSVASESLLSWSAKYRDGTVGSSGLPPEAEQILSAYRELSCA